MTGPLAGIRVIELAEVIQGPVAGRVLADLGAEVIKLEPPQGDSMRYWRTQFNVDTLLPNGLSLAFNLVNRNKKSIILDLHAESGIRLFHKLIANAHVFITNLSSEALGRFQADFASLSTINPSLIYAQGLGLGTEGDLASMPIYDLVGMAHSGFLFNASPDSTEPYYVVGALSDVLTGTYLGMGVLAALQSKQQTNAAQYVTCSQLQALMWLQMMNVGVAANMGVSFPPFDRGTRYNPLVNFYRAMDGKWFTINIPRPLEDWPKVCAAIERVDLLDDPRFVDLESRAQHREALTAILEHAFASKRREDWVQVFRQRDLWLGPVNRAEDLATDQQVIANGYLSRSEDGVISPRSIFSVMGQEVEAAPAPVLGRDTESILRGVLGLGDAELIKLKVEGATW